MNEHDCNHEADWGTFKEWRRAVTEKIDTILAQVKITNGRVTAGERWRRDIGVFLFAVMVANPILVVAILTLALTNPAVRGLVIKAAGVVP